MGFGSRQRLVQYRGPAASPSEKQSLHPRLEARVRQEIRNLATRRVSNDDDRAGRVLFDDLSHAVHDHSKREHGVANLRFLRGDLLLQKIGGDSISVFRARPAAMPVIARYRQEKNGDLLRQILTQAGIIELIDEELVPVRRSSVDDDQGWKAGNWPHRRQKESGDVPVEAIHPVALLDPFRPVTEPVARQRLELPRIEGAARRPIGQRLHERPLIREVPAELLEDRLRNGVIGLVLRQQLRQRIVTRHLGRSRHSPNQRHSANCQQQPMCNHRVTPFAGASEPHSARVLRNALRVFNARVMSASRQ